MRKGEAPVLPFLRFDPTGRLQEGRSGDGRWAPPPRPASCDRDFDWGNGFSILPSGTTTCNCATDTVLNKENPVLAYGEASTIGAITCDSRLDGLTCTHARTKRGFFLSRDSYKQF